MSWTILIILIVVATLAFTYGLGEWLVKRHQAGRNDTSAVR